MAPPPLPRKVRLLLSEPQAQPEEEGEDSTMALDEESAVSDAFTSSFPSQFLTLERLPRAVGGQGLPLRESGRARRQCPEGLQSAALGQGNAQILSSRLQAKTIPTLKLPEKFLSSRHVASF